MNIIVLIIGIVIGYMIRYSLQQKLINRFKNLLDDYYELCKKIADTDIEKAATQVAKDYYGCRNKDIEYGFEQGVKWCEQIKLK